MQRHSPSKVVEIKGRYGAVPTGGLAVALANTGPAEDRAKVIGSVEV
jgi:hypothetical protein